jgi:hypothetical protein
MSIRLSVIGDKICMLTKGFKAKLRPLGSGKT